jgi:hypothetical protein
MKYIITILVVLVVFVLVNQTTQKCSMTFQVHKGWNFNQPYPTYHDCGYQSIKPNE